jgi:molybdenum cofactor synthesis domain-containing protein
MIVVEILCVGNELLSGITLNTNAHWLAGQITRAGGTVGRVTVVGDELGAIGAAVQESLARKPAILITTGGLGVTYDDMTLEGMAKALGRPVILDMRAVRMLKDSYARRGLKYRINKVRLKMATIPEGSIPIENPVGTAPSVRVDVGGARIFCVPGVPVEMKAVFKKNILPLIKEGVGAFASREANYMVSGVSEAMIAPVLKRLVDANPAHTAYLKTHPQGYLQKTTPRIRIQIVCKGDDAGEVEERLARISRQMTAQVSRLGGRLE